LLHERTVAPECLRENEGLRCNGTVLRTRKEKR
jgi:hypothetical protein